MIHALTAGTKTTVYWEKAEDAQGAVYTILAGGRELVRTSSTYAVVDAPKEGETIDLEILRDGSSIGNTRVTGRAQKRRLSVLDFGAAGDGIKLNTESLQRAIDACTQGDELYFPAGTYLTGALRLHSDMTVYLEEGAVLQGTENPEDYLPKIPSRFEGTEMMCYQSLLNLGTMDHTGPANAGRVLIYGHGTISGGGQKLALNIIERERAELKEYIASLGEKVQEYENNNTIPGRPRGRLINLSNCEDVRITGLTLQNGASWNVHMLYSRGIVTDQCIFRSQNVWNGDGWDPDSSEDCTLFACKFFTGDDSVAIKSGKNPEGNRIARPTRHIRIFSCYSEEGLGIAIGSEMSGGVEDVRIWDCDLEHSLYGVQIKGTKKRGGYVKDVCVMDSRLSRFLVTAVKYNDDGEGAEHPPVFSGIRLLRDHFSCWARDYWEKEDHPVTGIELTGFEE
ncbi:MAG: glycoside hydrolase family 28 protein, partial [Clostridia bacterium]|nr:glycoside hydrolase family 28 protein [Clostridia bacterium]